MDTSGLGGKDINHLDDVKRRIFPGEEESTMLNILLNQGPRPVVQDVGPSNFRFGPWSSATNSCVVSKTATKSRPAPQNIFHACIGEDGDCYAPPKRGFPPSNIDFLPKKQKFSDKNKGKIVMDFDTCNNLVANMPLSSFKSGLSRNEEIQFGD